VPRVHSVGRRRRQVGQQARTGGATRARDDFRTRGLDVRLNDIEGQQHATLDGGIRGAESDSVTNRQSSYEPHVEDPPAESANSDHVTGVKEGGGFWHRASAARVQEMPRAWARG